MEGLSSLRHVDVSSPGKSSRDMNEEEEQPAVCRYECKVCNKGFRTKQALGGHQNAHNSERRFIIDYMRHVGTTPTYTPMRPAAPSSFARTIFPGPPTLREESSIPHPHYQNPSLGRNHLRSPALGWNLRRNSFVFPSHSTYPGHESNLLTMRSSRHTVFPEDPSFGQGLVGSTSVPLFNIPPDPVGAKDLAIRHHHDAKPVLKNFFPVSHPRLVKEIAPPLEATRHDDGVKVTINFLEAMSSWGESTPADGTDDYEKANLVGLDLSLHL